MRQMTAVLTAFAVLLSVASAQAAMPIEGERQFASGDRAPLTRLAQRLPSDVEQRYGIRPNSQNYGRRGDWDDRRGWDDRRYRRYDDRWDGRYRRPPPGYRRYSYRPRDWRRRGCIVVGPVWFCR